MAIPTGHERAAAKDRAADPIAQVLSRIAPIALDADPADKSDGNLPLGRTAQPAVERLQGEAQASRARIDGTAPRGHACGRAKFVQASNPLEKGRDIPSVDNSRDQQTDRIEETDARNRELKALVLIVDQDMLDVVWRSQQCHARGNVRELERARIDSRTDGQGGQAQHMPA